MWGGFDNLTPDAKDIIIAYMRDLFTRLNDVTDNLFSKIAYAFNNYSSTMELFNALSHKGLISKEVGLFLDKAFNEKNLKNNVIRVLSFERYDVLYIVTNPFCLGSEGF